MLVILKHRFAQSSALLLMAVWLFVPSLLVPSLAYAGSSLLQTAERQISAKKFKTAARTITKAMNSGTLTDKEMATALYRRGVAYNKNGRPGSAIADLTGALWLEKLERSARMDAFAQRAKAYEATGHKQQARRDYAKAGQSRTNFRSAAKSGRRSAPPARMPSFQTVVKTNTAKRQKRPSSQKPVIPSFRTSVATE